MVEAHDPFVLPCLLTPYSKSSKMDPKYKHVIESFGEVPAGEEVPLSEIELEDRARKAALHWYSPSRYRTSRPFLPPFLQFPFPLNLVRLTYATIRFNRESRSSRRRLEALADSPDAESSLAAILQKMEMAVADMVDPADPGVADEGWDTQGD
ncbi:hypothetical protein AG1IA_10045 [Rhizoctonia solani AG-1 IA]|uniref:Uncharacterized protein n=1 Tax=Thanatephorus cucumeris (strain AG1-IA) TaxID=983506 RepID=L8WD91_THACA|nr:hypothetical protein AG1IA_10045 [Rhizoctonia solani AG-1 IA]